MPLARLGVVGREGAAQSELRIGQTCTTRATPDYHALLVLNTILGGQFVSRLNLNLREQKGYTYGVRTVFDLRRGVGPFVMQTSVATDVTSAAITEALAEFRDIAGARPPTGDELALACASVTRGYPRGFETATQVVRSVAQLALHGLPDSYFDEFIPRVNAIAVEGVARVAREYLDTARMSVVIVGDVDKIGPTLETLGLGRTAILSPEF
jgi:predicted Zn-dependent peptidase